MIVCLLAGWEMSGLSLDHIVSKYVCYLLLLCMAHDIITRVGEYETGANHHNAHLKLAEKKGCAMKELIIF